eukprot:symbB.v1.2.037618.t1/scaffold5605.1/size25388/3
MMSFCFQQPAVASSNTSPKAERPGCVGISTSSVHFPGASQGQWSEFDVAARRLCRCSSYRNGGCSRGTRQCFTANTNLEKTNCEAKADKRLLKELEELVKQRDRLQREREALWQQAEEHDREVQSFVHVLKALPQAKVMPEVLKQEMEQMEDEVWEAEQEMKAYQHSLPTTGHLDMEKHQEVQEELLQCQQWGEETAQQQEVCEEQAKKLQAEMSEMQSEAWGVILSKCTCKKRDGITMI